MLHIDKDDIKKKRVIKLFIEAASKIIDEEGIEAITIRRVGKETGYNSATIYSYFDNLRQLVFFAAASKLHDYIEAMPGYIARGTDELERFLLMWDCFCRYSFMKPRVYHAIFCEDIGALPDALVDHYYQLFPEELNGAPEELIPMLRATDLKQRNLIAIQGCVREGFFSPRNAESMEEAVRLVYIGMLNLIVGKRTEYSREEAEMRTMEHIRKIASSCAAQHERSVSAPRSY